VQTNPPATNAAVQEMTGKIFTRQVDQLPLPEVLKEIDAKVDFDKMEAWLMEDGLKKFADPQKELLQMIARRRRER
jgi:transaldolase